MIRYSDITVNDRNPVKRKLQRIRLQHSLKVLRHVAPDFSECILDFGAGDATLARFIRASHPHPPIFCFEPASELRQQAVENTADLENVQITGNLNEIKHLDFAYIFCLEVLEHLTEPDIRKVLTDIYKLCNSATKIIIGVPNEIYLTAFIKGIFRLTRRAGDVDARPRNILRATLGLPIPGRPVGELSADVPYIFRHIGFDYRELIKTIRLQFHIRQMYGSPFPLLPLFFNFELYFICQKKNPAETG